MKIILERKNKAMHFVATNVDGNTVHLDSSPDAKGEGKGTRPMELVMMSLAGCSSIDMVLFLEKMRQPLEDIRVETVGERVENAPRVFKKIHLTFHLTGDLKPEKVEKALSLSLDQYCSVAKMLETSVEITADYIIHPTT